MGFNPLAAFIDALKTWPEQVQLPEALLDATPVELAEARNRYQAYSQCATELRKTIDTLLASHLAGGALRYGESIMRPAYRGRPKVVDDGWWETVISGLSRSDHPEGLLGALYPASSVRLTALPQLAEALGYEDDTSLRDTFIEYELPTMTLDVLPLAKAPKWTHQLAEGQFSGEKNNE